jgi:hypothetical protein
VKAWIRNPRCSLVDIACLVVPVWLAIMVSATSADADLWGHLRFGADLLAGHGLSAADPYSFTADTPWVNHEWLSELLLAAFYRGAGPLGLNLLKLVIIALIGLLTWRTGERHGGSPFALTLLTTLVLFASYTRTQNLRPQLFSALLFTLLLVLLERRAHRGKGAPGGDRSLAASIVVPALFCVWANAHGAWIVGFATLCVWAAFDVLEERSVGAIARGSALVLASAAATLVNPYGAGNWAFLRRTVGLSRDDITDWTPFARFPWWLIAFELVLPVMALLAMRRCRRWPPARHAAIIGVLAFGTYRVGRVDAFLQIAIGLLLAPVFIELFVRVERALRESPRLGTASRLHGWVAVAIVVITAGFGATRLGHIYIAGDWTPDPEAVRFLRTHSTNTRLLTWFDWGEYAIWHLSPAGVRVSMDGRRETVYSEKMLADHWAFYRNVGEASGYPETIGADEIWLPKRLPIVPVLRERGWHALFESGESVVLSRDAQPTLVAAAAHPALAFFPGP